MGMETAAIVMAAVSVGAEVGKMGMEISAAQKRGEALDLMAKQMKLQNQQKTLANYDKIEKVLEAQEAAMTVRGVAFSSPSFNAIQRATLNIGSKAQKNIDIEGSLALANIEMEKQNVKTTLFAQLFGDVSTIASSAASAMAKAPSMGGGAPSKLPQMEA